MTQDEKLERILETSVRLSEKFDGLVLRLYGQEQDKGDIPELREYVRAMNGFRSHCEGRLGSLEGKMRIVIIALVASGVLGGTIAGVINL